MRQPIRRLVLVLMLCLAAGRPMAQAPVAVSVDSGNPPYMYETAGGASGIYPALVRAAFREMGVAVQVQAKPWRRCIADLEAGLGGVAGLYKVQERLQKYDFSDALLVERVNVYMLRSRSQAFNGLQDLKGLRVGVIAGWSYSDDVSAALKTRFFQAEEVASDEQNFAKLALGRLDAVIAVEHSADPQLQRHPQVRLAGTLIENPTFLAFHKSTRQTELLQRFNAAMQRLRERGDFARIVHAAIASPVH